MLRTVIADDEPLALRRLVLALQNIDEIALVGSARDGASALALVEEMRPDLLIIDIQMPGLSGLQLVNTLDHSVPPAIIFVTAFDRFAAQAFDQGAVDYVLKPIGEARLKRAIARAHERLRGRDAGQHLAELRQLVAILSNANETSKDEAWLKELWISDRGTVLRVAVEAVNWFEAAGDYVVVHASDRNHVVHDSLRSLEARLDPKRFRRVHRSAIVRLEAVASLERLKFGALRLRLSDGDVVSIGRTYRKEVEEALRRG